MLQGLELHISGQVAHFLDGAPKAPRQRFTDLALWARNLASSLGTSCEASGLVDSGVSIFAI